MVENRLMSAKSEAKRTGFRRNPDSIPILRTPGERALNGVPSAIESRDQRSCNRAGYPDAGGEIVYAQGA
jgi:hypothetical protein